MKIATSFLAALLLAGSLGVGSALAAADGVISNEVIIGRHLISVQWDNGVIDYVYPLEIELLGQRDEPAFNVVN